MSVNAFIFNYCHNKQTQLYSEYNVPFEYLYSFKTFQNVKYLPLPLGTTTPTA